MQYQVPQYIQKETKIVGPLTFRQFAYLGLAGGIIFILYFTVGRINFTVFLLVTIILFTAASLLAFLRIEGRELPAVAENAFNFFLASRLYVWKKKTMPPKIILKKLVTPKMEAKKGPSLKIVGRGQLKDLASKIGTGNR